MGHVSGLFRILLTLLQSPSLIPIPYLHINTHTLASSPYFFQSIPFVNISFFFLFLFSQVYIRTYVLSVSRFMIRTRAFCIPCVLHFHAGRGLVFFFFFSPTVTVMALFMINEFLSVIKKTFFSKKLPYCDI